LSLELATGGMTVDVFTRSQSPQIARVVPLAPGVRVIHVPAGPEAPYDKGRLWEHLPEFVAGIQRFTRQEGIRYDLLHTHYWLSGWAGWMLKGEWGVPQVQMFHTLARLKNHAVQDRAPQEPCLRVEAERIIMRMADRIVAASPLEKAHMNWYYNCPPERVEVVPCGINLQLFRPGPRPTTRGASSLLYVGRIEPIKGLDVLIRAVGLLVRGSPALREGLELRIIGGEADEDARMQNRELHRLKRLAASLGIEGLVRFMGPQPQEALPAFYARAALCVLPSRYESFGMVALEAMACGTPVIASRVGGLPFIVRDGATGLLVPEGNSRLLADTIGQLLRDERRREAMSVQAARFAQGFAWSRVAEQIAGLYRAVLARRDQSALRLR
ncbi:MAG: glycosyltransferase, partial [Deltaproteobacteria bacterium]|nr:glycosyltransferase [Deltaproteobacteria bacterium]